MCTKLSSLSKTYFHCIAYSYIPTFSILFSLQCLFICIDIVNPFSSRYAYPMSCAIITPHDIVSMNCTILMTLCPYDCSNKIHHVHLTCVWGSMSYLWSDITYTYSIISFGKSHPLLLKSFFYFLFLIKKIYIFHHVETPSQGSPFERKNLNLIKSHTLFNWANHATPCMCVHMCYRP